MSLLDLFKQGSHKPERHGREAPTSRFHGSEVAEEITAWIALAIERCEGQDRDDLQILHDTLRRMTTPSLRLPQTMRAHAMEVLRRQGHDEFGLDRLSMARTARFIAASAVFAPPARAVHAASVIPAQEGIDLIAECEVLRKTVSKLTARCEALTQMVGLIGDLPSQ